MKPIKSAMQSGESKNKWVMEPIVSPNKRSIEPFLGRISSSDMQQEIRLCFNSLPEAVKFAEAKKYSYEVIEPSPRKIIKKSYADNFTNRS